VPRPFKFPQRPRHSIPLVGADSIFSRADVAQTASGSYALYIQSSEPLAGYQHVTFNSVSTLFENNGVCSTPLDQQAAHYSKPRMLSNVHSSTFATTYPSTINIHNYSAAATTVSSTAYNATTGTTLGQTTRQISANGTFSALESDLEQLLQIGNPPQHINFEVASGSGGAAPVILTHTVRNTKLAGDVNMAQACAVNYVPATVVQVPVAPTTPTAYCGTFRYPAGVPYPYNLMTLNFVVSVAPNGRIRGSVYGFLGDAEAGDTINGTLSGTTWSATSTEGLQGSGSIQNGNLSGSFVSPLGNLNVSGSTAACN